MRSPLLGLPNESERYMAKQPRQPKAQRQPARPKPDSLPTTDNAKSEPRTIPHLDLAAEALISRVKRDQGYLAYRKACNRRTSYDSQVQQDIRALSLAAVWLEDSNTASSERPSPHAERRRSQ